MDKCAAMQRSLAGCSVKHRNLHSLEHGMQRDATKYSNKAQHGRVVLHETHHTSGREACSRESLMPLSEHSVHSSKLRLILPRAPILQQQTGWLYEVKSSLFLVRSLSNWIQYSKKGCAGCKL